MEPFRVSKFCNVGGGGGRISLKRPPRVKSLIQAAGNVASSAKYCTHLWTDPVCGFASEPSSYCDHTSVRCAAPGEKRSADRRHLKTYERGMGGGGGGGEGGGKEGGRGEGGGRGRGKED